MSISVAPFFSDTPGTSYAGHIPENAVRTRPNVAPPGAQIKAAIACIAQGIQLEVFDGKDGSQLLYAAQVALSVHRETKGKKK